LLNIHFRPASSSFLGLEFSHFQSVFEVSPFQNQESLAHDRSSSVVITILSLTKRSAASLAVEACERKSAKIAVVAKPFRFRRPSHGKGELKYINGLPVVSLVGTPEEIGEQ